MSQEQINAGYSADELSKILEDKVWIKDPSGKTAFENIRNYDNMPAYYKNFIKKEDGFSIIGKDIAGKENYKFNVKYWDNSDSFSVSRIKIEKKGYGTDYAKPGDGGAFKKFPQRTIYRDAAVTVASTQSTNVLLADRVPNGFWTVISSYVHDGEPVFALVRKEKI
jgi:hypothetical protein